MNTGPKPLVRRFTFDQSFDEEPFPVKARGTGRRGASVPDAPPAPPAPPVFTREDLQASHEQGYQEGHAAARQEAAESAERATATALERIAAALQGLDRERSEANERTGRLAGEIAVGIARKLLPHLAERHGIDEVEALVRQSLASLLTPVKITIRVATDAVPPMRERLDLIAAQTGFAGQALVIADPDLGPGDAAVEWGDGGATHDSARIWREIDAAVAAAASRPQPMEPTVPTTKSAAIAAATPEPAEPARAPIRQGPQPKVRPVAPPPKPEPAG